MKVSDILKNITEIQNPDYVRFMNEDEINQFKKYQWLVWNSIKRINTEPEILVKLAQNQQSLERVFDKQEQWYSLLIDIIPKGEYKIIYPKKVKKKNYDYDFINLLTEDLKVSTRECEDYYDLLEHQGILEEEKTKLYSKYGMEYEKPVQIDKIQMVKIHLLKEHPINNEIYSSSRKTEDEELEENIKIYGLLQPIIVDKKTNYIISGNRRFQACKNIGLKEVKVIKSSFDYDVISLINFNKYRTKTTIEKVNEYRMMKDEIKRMGYKDRRLLMNGMKMRDYIFQQTGVSHKTEHQLSFVESKNPKLAEMVLTGEISIKKAYQEVNNTSNKKGSDVKGDLVVLENLLKKLYPNVDLKEIDKIVKRVYGE